MIHYLLKILDSSSIEKAQEELQKLGLQDEYIIEEKDTTFIGGNFEKQLNNKDLKNVSIEKEYFEYIIDWEAEASHSPYYKDNLIQVPLNLFSKENAHIIRLYPGPGFGDLSHPTTELMLSLIPDFSNDATIVDMGCGNGVLSFAAHYFGAKKVYGIDICKEAISQAKKNLFLNESPNIIFSEILSAKEGSFILFINMIFSEQLEVFKTYPNLLMQCKVIIASGILEEDACEYISFIENQSNLKLHKHSFLKDWSGLIFTD
ncbi:MAG TPA: 50S ribosomal protein L11 methyltransferase [Chlamydiales bacterium]|nr:50S ribosomal protein L11 methyltransferase [Chlamydiales bacterium]